MNTTERKAGNPLLSEMFKFQTISDAMRSAGGIGPGFDVLRISLAILILMWHCLLLTYGPKFFETYDGFFLKAKYLLVPMFFAVSGFLVAGSAIRVKSVKTFLIFRALRIFPALTLVVTICAFLVGPMVTTLTLPQYFKDHHFFEYFGNIIGRIRFELPGVFETNPNPRVVNGSLWTLQPEFYFYLLMAAIMATKLVYSRFLYSTLFLTASAVLVACDGIYGIGSVDKGEFYWVVMYCFFVGFFFFHWKDKIYVSPIAGALAFFLAVWMVHTHGLGYLAMFPVCYVICCIGMMKMPELKIVNSGDYSYGIYLCGYPIQQLIIYCFPGIKDWEVLFAPSLVAAWIFAYFSWHYVEKPALQFKKHFLPAGRRPKASA